MAEAKQGKSRRVEQWRREVLELQSRAMALVVEDRKASNDKPYSELAAELAEGGFHLLWAGWSPALVFASTVASLKTGRPVLAVSPVKTIPGMPQGLMDEEVEAPQKLHRDASEVRVIREADPLPDREPVPQCVEALELEPEEIEVEEEPEPIPEVEPEPALPVVITEEQCEDTPAPEPAAAEPAAEPPTSPTCTPERWMGERCRSDPASGLQ
jgi:hypothetical protein